MGFDVVRFDSVGSTMDEARGLADAGKGSAFIVMAEHQRRGRGRIEGRTWEASRGSALLATVALPDAAAIPGASLKVGLGVIDLLTSLAPDIDFKVKWPNDILAPIGQGYGKIAGILCEARSGWLLAGVGLNLRRHSYPQTLTGKAVSLDEAIEANRTGIEGGYQSPEDRIGLAQRLAAFIGSRLADGRWRGAYEGLLWLRGERARFSAGHPGSGSIVEGVVAGVDEEGALRIRLPDGSERSFASGEILAEGFGYRSGSGAAGLTL